MATFEVADGVYGIDTGLLDEGFTAVYLFDDEEPTLVDTGAPATADAVLEGIRDCGVAPDSLEHVICSHVHTDHAGGASTILEAAPDADVYIHELTASHLEDPAALVESSRRAMGEHFEAMGEQEPVPEERIVTVPDSGITLEIGANSLELIHAPGHSPDHLAVWNPERDLLFAAECIGLYLEPADRLLAPGSPPNFDVDDVHEAISTLRALEPETIVFPHFGVWPRNPDDAFETAEETLETFDRRVLEIYEETGSVAETIEVAADELVDTAPPYDERLEAFQAELVTKGFLLSHGIEV
ncbi:MBL fold metallo-hydrolase [Natrarchaeobaculum aegyptiacum]|uniref:MBL fold metallo-hydrolase n=1 Tax=Natrarchaeobaculum aegyptiacum TaxID=745377 RepID=A0A2Z2HYI5_9EURY|nr:MBL fold metallo-hydrolase [Natrarchaeobaculum aegyptiacum]ARS88598.1 MBL fold metallo-hydrolase [Natrarchaeobaculum aegyptiacum]